ncbi:Spy/CpxP family protein refolding chaperone [Pyxidicoccus xibeiensis]|uniref:Spy/CpxP family protein refolding chaperone n=1 Tax=Pyxidicoccus xibeiensis TaxID=2906759 RepID=UPI0020A7B37D|nr:periplasmic heavy metal sensor [Pyxidicoccus xibeiensis]MCP3142801.1 periplasmic heavy metal sensor [Pyxidicoccus xibeiensis]
MSKKLAVAGSAVLAVVLLSGFAFRGGHHGFGRDPERIKQMVTWKLNDKLEDLDASEAQTKSINAVKDRLFDEGVQLMQEQRAARTEALTQLESANPDAQKLHSLVDARIDAFRAFAHKATDALLEVHRTLTPAQRNELFTEYREHTGQK